MTAVLPMSWHVCGTRVGISHVGRLTAPEAASTLRQAAKIKGRPDCLVHGVSARPMEVPVHPYVSVLQTYMDALGRSDYGTVKGLFTPCGQVKSPFLGEMPAGPFFDRLAGASAMNVIAPIDIFLSNSGKNHATAYFQYDWTVRDGTLITFKVMDLFTFEPDSDKVTYLDIIYDTHPIRTSAGNKYEL